MAWPALKIGALAKRTGLTVRTLHHYDDIGLLKPTLHTDSGHRLYGTAGVARLQRVIALRQLGFSLEEVGRCLDQPAFSPLDVIRLHIARLREQIELHQRLCTSLEGLAKCFRDAEEVSADELIRTIEVMTMMEKYYTPEQMDYLKKQGEQVGQERIREVEAEWPKLIALVRAEMEKGTDPATPQVQELAKRWLGLINEFTGGNAGVAQSLKNLWKDQGAQIVQQHGLDPKMAEISEYIGKAIALVKGQG